MTHKQESGRTVLETIAVLTIAAVLLITSIGGIAFLIQSNNRKQSTKEVASMVTALKTSNVLRKYDEGEQIPVREVVQGPKASDAHNEVMILSEGKDSFMIVTALGNNEFVADVQVQPGTCSSVLEALGQDEISVAVFEKTDRVDTAGEFSNPISLAKGSVQFQKLKPEQIDLCNETGIFAFKMGNPAYLYDESLHLCPHSQIEDIYGACCAPSKACGNVCSCPSGQRCNKDRKVCVECLSDSDCDAKHICKDNQCQEVDCTQNSDCPTITPICNTERYECESCPTDKHWNESTSSCVECANNDHCSGGQVCNTASNTCVECTDNDDCSGGKVCNAENTCACPEGEHWNGTSCVECANNDHCSGGKVCNTENNTCVCPAEKPNWNDSTSSCVECANNDHCSGGKVCNTASNTCVECTNNDNCSGGKVCNTENNTCACPEGEHWNGQACVECINDDNCSGGKVCNTENTCACPTDKPNWNESTSSCVECANNSHCSGGQVCNTVSNTCVECTDNDHCSGDKVCNAENTCACPAEKPKWNESTSSCVECLTQEDCPKGEFCRNETYSSSYSVTNTCITCQWGYKCGCPDGTCSDGVGGCLTEEATQSKWAQLSIRQSNAGQGKHGCIKCDRPGMCRIEAYGEY